MSWNPMHSHFLSAGEVERGRRQKILKGTEIGEEGAEKEMKQKRTRGEIHVRSNQYRKCSCPQITFIMSEKAYAYIPKMK